MRSLEYHTLLKPVNCSSIYLPFTVQVYGPVTARPIVPLVPCVHYIGIAAPAELILEIYVSPSVSRMFTFPMWCAMKFKLSIAFRPAISTKLWLTRFEWLKYVLTLLNMRTLFVLQLIVLFRCTPHIGLYTIAHILGCVSLRVICTLSCRRLKLCKKKKTNTNYASKYDNLHPFDQSLQNQPKGSMLYIFYKRMLVLA